MSLGVIDVGTTNMRLIIYDDELKQSYLEAVNVPMLFPGGLRAEQDSTALRAAFNHLIKASRERGVKLLGISTYRASMLAWDREGNPLTNVVTWLDRRGMEVVSKFPLSLLARVPPLGSIMSPSSPVAQVLWFIRNEEKLIHRVRRGEAFMGTLSSYIAYLVSGEYVDDAANEALTGLWHPGSFRRISAIYDVLRIPREVGPEVVDDIHDIGEVDGVRVGVLTADQQAAMIGEGCLRPGCVKITNGTGSFVDMAVGGFRMVGRGLLPLLVLKAGGEAFYGVEGFLPATGSVMDWLVRLGLIGSPQELDGLAGVDARGLLVVPALAGVNVPPRPCALGLVSGLGLDTTRESFVRAVLEGMVQLIGLIFDSMRGIAEVSVVRVAGGLSKSSLFLKLLATALNVRVERQRDVEATARGTAALLKVFRGDWSIRDLVGGAQVEVETSVAPGEEGLSLNRDAVRRAVRGMKCRTR
ncbi:glycerol kinase [Thermocladium modestius]|uniref:Glycerol kinase n=1 Tax=Thermocladium modestius TaxID=62609 RepID=A0A830GUZ0_9CREN|nr:FGGY-family carbohydrate kinase [Thermocladium modestius]GGP19761.1 glycerol kinase [Thermocladium modestius]